jgi:L-arabinose isomerase
MIDSRIVDAEVWFVTGSQSMYGEETLDQVASQSR